MPEAADGQNRLRVKERALTIGGKSLTICYTMTAMLASKERWQIETDVGLVKRLNQRRTTDLPALVHACTRIHHPELTYSQCLRWCDEATLEEVGAIARTVSDAIEAGYPEEAKADGAQEKKPQPAPVS